MEVWTEMQIRGKSKISQIMFFAAAQNAPEAGDPWLQFVMLSCTSEDQLLCCLWEGRTTLLTHLHILFLHGLEVWRVLGQVPVGCTQVVDIPRPSLHSAGVVWQAGQLTCRQC